jgi:CrcB protein
MIEFTLLGLLSGFGASIRYLVSKFNSKDFALGTFLVNILGAFLLGFLFSHFGNAPQTRIIGVGFCGGLTTFSTFNVELFGLIEREKYTFAFLYFTSSTLLGFLFCGLGMYLGGL